MRAGIADQKPAWREGLALGQTDAHDSHQNLWVHPPTMVNEPTLTMRALVVIF